MITLKELLIKHEGLRLKPYKDSVGKLTIGVGRNLDDVGLTEQEALYLLHNDINKAIKDAKVYAWFDPLDDVRKMVVVDMIFNLGLTRFSGFKRTIKHIASRRYKEAAIEMMDSKWARQVGPRAIELSKMMSSGGV